MSREGNFSAYHCVDSGSNADPQYGYWYIDEAVCATFGDDETYVQRYSHTEVWSFSTESGYTHQFCCEVVSASIALSTFYYSILSSCEQTYHRECEVQPWQVITSGFVGIGIIVFTGGPDDGSTDLQPHSW